VGGPGNRAAHLLITIRHQAPSQGLHKLRSRMKSAEGAGGTARPRGPWASAWLRMKRDRATVAAMIALLLIVGASLFGGAIATRLVGHGGEEPFPYATGGSGQGIATVGQWTRVPDTSSSNLDEYGNLQPPTPGTPTTLFVLGGDGILGRDELIRLLDGGRTSLEIGLGGVLFALLVAIPFGALAGYFGGVTDAIVSRVTETVMAFPMLLFLVFATAKLSPTLRPIAYGNVLPVGVFSDALLIGLFTSFYPTRLIRQQLISLRQSEWVDAAYMIGSSDARILRRDLLPHVIPTMLIWGAIAVATNILLEVSLSFIGVGVQPFTSTWGSMLSQAWGTLFSSRIGEPTIWQTIFPTAAILVTVVSLNQIAEGVRRALEPWARR
jgi:ABC-type dipeptide/oligopeptide/nickel transport system permease subunit